MLRDHLPILAIPALALALLIAGCGGDDGYGEASGPPAAGANTPAAGTPGVEPGVPYDVDGDDWERLGQTDRFEAATRFIEDNPERCEGADVGIVTFYVTNSYGLDFPRDIPAADVLAEGCDAALQS